MTVFGSVTATISPTLSSYIRYKGKVWKAAFIASLETVAGVEYTVYKKKGCWQIKGDWEKIKHAHRILTKVTTVEDWSGHLEREALRLEQAAVVTPTQTPKREPAEKPTGTPGGGEEDQDANKPPNNDRSCDGTGEKQSPCVKNGEEVQVKSEPIEPGDENETTVTTGSVDTGNPNMMTPIGPPSPVHTPTTESIMPNLPTEPKPSFSRRKRGRPRKVEMVYTEPGTDDDDSPTLDMDYGEKMPKIEDGLLNLSDCNESDAEESNASDDPDFTIDKMVQQGKANLKTRSKEKTYPCDKCDFVCKSKGGVFEHQQRQHNAKTLTCPICNKAYGVRRDLRKHITRHTSQYKCEECGKCYKEERNYKQHLRTHEKDYVPTYFACEQCEKSFTTKYVLMTHVEQIHRGHVPEWLCTTCGKKFKQKHSLIEHNLIHTGERPYVCKICNKTFRHKGTCVNHELLHTNVRLYTCEVCGKDFKHRNSLRIHASVHRTERQYGCTFCDKKFTQKQAMIRHTRIHSGEKPFMCDLCGDRFNDNSILRRHMMGVHKTILKSGKQHYVLPAEQYEENAMEMNDGEGGLIDTEATAKEGPVHLIFPDRSPGEEEDQHDESSVDHPPPSLLGTSPLASTGALQEYRHVANSLPSPFSAYGNILGGAGPSSIGGTGMLLPVVAVANMDQYGNHGESPKDSLSYTTSEPQDQYIGEQQRSQRQQDILEDSPYKRLY